MNPNNGKELLVAFISMLGGALTSYFTFRGKKAEADSPVESIYTKEVRAIIDDYREERAALQKEKAELLAIIDQVKARNTDLERENHLLKTENVRLASQVDQLDEKVKELSDEVEKLGGASSERDSSKN